jgi:GT2 family glycosyltransferase
VGEVADAPLSSTVRISTAPTVAARRPLVTVVTLCWNHSYLIRDFLTSFNKRTAPESLAQIQMVVVDNGSVDDTPAILEKWRLDPGGPAWRTVVRSPTNLGFGVGANLAVRQAEGRYLLLLNNDVEFQGDLVKACLQAYPRGRRALIGRKLIHRPGPWNQLHGKSVRYLEGWCLFATMEVFREVGSFRDETLVGIFDETFTPAFFEDMDLSLRAHLSGIELREVRLPVSHLESRTTRGTPSFHFMDVIHENQRRFQAKWRDIAAEAL